MTESSLFPHDLRRPNKCALLGHSYQVSGCKLYDEGCGPQHVRGLTQHVQAQHPSGLPIVYSLAQTCQRQRNMGSPRATIHGDGIEAFVLKLC